MGVGEELHIFAAALEGTCAVALGRSDDGARASCQRSRPLWTRACGVDCLALLVVPRRPRLLLVRALRSSTRDLATLRMQLMKHDCGKGKPSSDDEVERQNKRPEIWYGRRKVQVGAVMRHVRGTPRCSSWGNYAGECRPGTIVTPARRCVRLAHVLSSLSVRGFGRIARRPGYVTDVSVNFWNRVWSLLAKAGTKPVICPALRPFYGHSEPPNELLAKSGFGPCEHVLVLDGRQGDNSGTLVAALTGRRPTLGMSQGQKTEASGERANMCQTHTHTHTHLGWGRTPGTQSRPALGTHTRGAHSAHPALACSSNLSSIGAFCTPTPQRLGCRRPDLGVSSTRSRWGSESWVYPGGS